jgi:hypothetical protein
MPIAVVVNNNKSIILYCGTAIGRTTAVLTPVRNNGGYQTNTLLDYYYVFRMLFFKSFRDTILCFHGWRLGRSTVILCAGNSRPLGLSPGTARLRYNGIMTLCRSLPGSSLSSLSPYLALPKATTAARNGRMIPGDNDDDNDDKKNGDNGGGGFWHRVICWENTVSGTCRPTAPSAPVDACDDRCDGVVMEDAWLVSAIRTCLRDFHHFVVGRFTIP